VGHRYRPNRGRPTEQLLQLLTTVSTGPRAATIAAATRGSGCRVRRYVRPISSYSVTDT
jgi:hypothetical protein